MGWVRPSRQASRVERHSGFSGAAGAGYRTNMGEDSELYFMLGHQLA